MPIGDLLAQISGDPSAPASTTATSLSRSNTLPKRKADDDIRSVTPKAPRVTTLSTTIGPKPSEAPRPRPSDPSRPSQSSRPLDRPIPAQRPSNSTTNPSKPNVLTSRPMNGGNRVQKPASSSRPAPGPSNPPTARGVPPKKGSFAEILARAQRAQATMGQVGKIQHKKAEGGVAKKEKDDPKTDPRPDPRAAKKGKQTQAAGYAGTAKPGQRPLNGQGRDALAKDGRNGKALPTRGPPGKGASAKSDRGRGAPVEEEKKVKKAATATVGYTGTARPKPGASSHKRDGPRGGALLSVSRPRPSHSRSRYEDDYDEELDDFIDYDDEEDEQEGPRYNYASDESSDMEAGLDDIDVEERKAERIARQEDIEEQRLEMTLKQAKEERKRKALEAIRAGRRR